MNLQRRKTVLPSKHCNVIKKKKYSFKTATIRGYYRLQSLLHSPHHTFRWLLHLHYSLIEWYGTYSSLSSPADAVLDASKQNIHVFHVAGNKASRSRSEIISFFPRLSRGPSVQHSRAVDFRFRSKMRPELFASVRAHTTQRVKSHAFALPVQARNCLYLETLEMHRSE